MNEIKCPHCTKTFNLDDAGYADILKQVKNHEFEIELEKREKELERQRQDALKLADAQANEKLQAALRTKDAELAELRAKVGTEVYIKVREKLLKGVVTKLPFVKGGV